MGWLGVVSACCQDTSVPRVVAGIESRGPPPLAPPLHRHTQRLQPALRPFNLPYLRLYPFLPIRETFGSWAAPNIGPLCVNTKYTCIQSRKIDVMNKRNQWFFLFQLEKMLLFPFSLPWISKVKGNACYLQIVDYSCISLLLCTFEQLNL